MTYALVGFVVFIILVFIGGELQKTDTNDNEKKKKIDEETGQCIGACFAFFCCIVLCITLFQCSQNLNEFSHELEGSIQELERIQKDF